MREKEYRIWPGLVVSLLLAFACGVFVYQVMGFTYDIADDIIMRDIASGAFTGTPDGHLIFVRYALGFLISRLYLLNRSVDWYGFVIAGAPFLGLQLCCTGDYRRRRTWDGRQSMRDLP